MRQTLRVAGTLMAFLSYGCSKDSPPTGPVEVKTLPIDQPHPLSTWKPVGRPIAVAEGIVRWQEKSEDGTELNLFRIAFQQNPKLRFGFYDQDEDDTTPFDNKVDYFPNGISAAMARISTLRRVRPLLIWNGLFFAYDRRPGSPPEGWGRHIGPNVIEGKARYNVGSHRWTFGIKNANGHPQFKTLFKPKFSDLASRFDFAADGAQCLVFEGKPLKLQPFPKIGDPPLAQPVTSTAEEAGHIPLIDHMRTSRTSLAWSRDSHFLYFLFLRETDNETNSKMIAKYGGTDRSGWTLADLQRFWMNEGVWGAVNSDGGSVAQMAFYDRGDNHGGDTDKYTYIPTKVEGGTLMYFYVGDSVDK